MNATLVPLLYFKTLIENNFPLHFENHPAGLSGFCGIDVNKLCHSLNGNRRNIGYTYLALNCDKGFLAQKKIEDVKISAEKYRPHVIGISEVNFKRNEDNKDIFSNTCLSTEQLIVGRNMVLPE